MTPEAKSKIVSLIGEIDGLRSREPDEKKFRDWKEKVEKQLEESCGKGSEEYSRFQRLRFFNFAGGGRAKDAPLNERERREYLSDLDEAKRVLVHCI